MAIFRDLSQRKTDTSDRSLGDRARHKDIIKEAIKKRLPEIIVEEDIMGDTGSKKIKIPIRSAKEWRFVYSERRDGAGQGEDYEPGDQVGAIGSGDRPVPGIGGNEPGEITIEITLDLDEAIDLMFEDLHLPFLEQKKFHELEYEDKTKWQGIKDSGIEPRLDLEASFIEKLKRQKMLESRQQYLETTNPEEAERLRSELDKNPFPFRDEDLRYHGLTTKIVTESNAVIFAVTDVSGSMDVNKRYLAKAFILLLHRFIKRTYRRVDMIFIGHHTEAFEVTENEFFHLSSSGGTCISSGPLKVLEFIKTRYPVELWNMYVVHCSDGENYTNDDENAIRAFKELAGIANLIGFVEIKSGGEWSTIGEKLAQEVKSPHFQILQIREKGQVWPKFQNFLTCDKKYKE